jgi:hypothetical protein
MNTAFVIPAQAKWSKIKTIYDSNIDCIPLLLRVEALIELAVAVTAYRHAGGTWLLFAGLFLVPDVSMAGYIVGPRAGARLYNLGHTYIAPALLALVGVVMAIKVAYLSALIWAAHIGFDRILGYGLKYPTAFHATHLGWKGPRGASDREPR